MVCGRCILAVEEELSRLGFPVMEIKLGEAVVAQIPDEEQLAEIKVSLKRIGFELIGDKKGQIIENIKTIIIEYIHYGSGIESPANLSEHLSKKIGSDYSYLSNLFSSVEGITIEKYLIRQKIERAKELLAYNELSLKEISWELGYSSVQHLSNQFRKITGLSPSQFKKSRSVERKPLDQV
jgi:YesN/AraC family two-component response regulator